MIVRALCLLLMLVGLSACNDSSSEYLTEKTCPHWSVGVYTPKHMEAWVEALYAKDNHDHWVNIPQGMAGQLATTEGWDSVSPAMSGVSIDSAGPPMEIFVRWQSLAEPQTYKWRFTVPESLRQTLLKHETIVWQGRTEQRCRSSIIVGVAPGGRAIVWLKGISLPRIEVMRGQATVEPLGPDQGQHEGRYVRISDEAQQYVKEHGIPYGSWDQ